MKKRFLDQFEYYFSRLLILLLGILMIINVLMPSRESSVSENRNLTQFPGFSWSSVGDGTFFSEVSDWFSDQFIGRSGLIHIRYLMQKCLGQKEINGVYLTNKGLVEEIEEMDSVQLDRNLSAINELYEYAGINTYFMLVPNSANVYSSYLPKNTEVVNQDDQINYVYNALNEEVVTLNVTDTLKEHSDEYLYYKSDHHWTSLAAFYALSSSASTLGIGKVEKSDFTIYPASKNFRGTLANKTGSISWKDEIDIYVPKNEVDYMYTNEGAGTKSRTIFDSDALETNDQYSVFMGGNYSIAHLEMDQNSNRHLLIIKDSYANCLIPMLIPYFRTITIVDPRYYYDDLSRVLTSDTITDILYLYNGNNFVTDASIADMIESALGE